MQDEGDSGGRRLIGEAARLRFIEALRGGASREEAAAAGAFPLGSFYAVRARDPLFRMAWEWAMELACIDERGGALARPVAQGETVRIVPQKGRLLQRRRMRSVKFTAKRQQIFLDRFAGTADAHDSAAAAGVSYDTVRAHYRRNADFADAWHEALRVAYALLEAEAVRGRIEAQRRLEDELSPTGETAQEFERVMKLLARWDRRGGAVGPRGRTPSGPGRWTFDEAIALLDKRLNDLGISRRLLPPPPEEPDL